MLHEALVIDDDPDVREIVAEILDSLGHRYDMATCQEEAREMLYSKLYSYYLVDLEIPVRAGRSLPRIQNGENLLAEIIRHRGQRHAPVIVITGHGKSGPQLAVRMMKLGASDYVTKPFEPEDKTLDRAILDALAKDGGRAQAPPLSESAESEETRVPRPFKGGELVLFRHRVELLGATVWRGRPDMLTRRILGALGDTRPSGGYVAYSGHELAEKVGSPGEVNQIAGAIRDFRQEVSRLLLEELNVQCGPQDVIQSGGPGYRFNQWIVVREGENGLAACSKANRGTDRRADGSANHDDDTDDPATPRRRWILAELSKGRRLRVSDVSADLKVSPRTVKRDLDALRRAGRIEFVGPARTGHYQLKKQGGVRVQPSVACSSNVD